MIVDVHSHCYPAAYLDLISRGDGVPADLRASDHPAVLDQRLETSATLGITKHIFSAGARVPDLTDVAAATTAAQSLNDSYRRLVDARPEALAAYASLPLPHLDASLAELERVLDLSQFVGVSVTSSIRGQSLARPEFEPLWAELSRRQSVLFVHPAGVSACSELIAEHGGTWTIGSPIEDTMAAMHLIASGILARHPGLRVVIPHLGGLLPSLVRRLDLLGARPGSPPPSEMVGRMFFDTVNGHPPALRAVVDTVGAGQLLYGSDFPYWADDALELSVRYLAEAGLTPAELDAIYSGNALRLHGMAAKP